MNPAVVQALGVVVAAALAAFAVIFSKRSDGHADQAAASESTGMAGWLIAGYQHMVEAGRIREAEGYAREAQLRIDLDDCVERARRRRAR